MPAREITAPAARIGPRIGPDAPLPTPSVDDATYEIEHASGSHQIRQRRNDLEAVWNLEQERTGQGQEGQFLPRDCAHTFFLCVTDARQTAPQVGYQTPTIDAALMFVNGPTAESVLWEPPRFGIMRALCAPGHAQ